MTTSSAIWKPTCTTDRQTNRQTDRQARTTTGDSKDPAVSQGRAVKKDLICHIDANYFSQCGHAAYYLQDCREAANCGYIIKFTHRPKIRFFARQGRLVNCTDSGQTLQDRRAPGSAWLCKICQNVTSIGAEGWECGPKNIKNFHFLVKSRPDSLDRFRIFFGALIRLTILRYFFQISCDSPYRLRSYCGETARW